MHTIELANYIKSPASKIFEALTTNEGLAATWTTMCNVENKEGGTAEFGFGDEPTTIFKIIKLKQNKEIVWQCMDSDPEWIGTFVSFEIQEKDKETLVVLKHSGWGEVTGFFRWCNYNWAFFLYSLKLYLEEGKGIPFQDRRF